MLHNNQQKNTLFVTIKSPRYTCFVTIYGVRANSKVGKALKQIGFSKEDWSKSFQLWNPGGYGGQNVDIKEAGAEAYAAKFQEITGITIYAGSRLD